MPTMFDVSKNELIEAIAKALKEMPELEPPTWSAFVKTGMHKERPPAREDWWHVRLASILLAVRTLGPVGVAKLRKKYGGRKNRGHKPDKFYKGSGNIIRKALQQLETASLIKKAEKGVHKGRVVTPQGTSLIDKTSGSLYKKPTPTAETPKPVAPKPAAPKQETPKPAAPKPEAPKA